MLEDKRLTTVTKARLASLDILRGITVAGMILVTDPGTYDAVYPQLLHAQWQGAHVADMIFPCFLVMVGIALTLSLSRRLQAGANPGRLWMHVARRSAIVLVLGLLINAFPDFQWHTLRLPGVLQRIALCYFAGAGLYLLLCRKYGENSPNHRRRPYYLVLLTSALLLVAYYLLLRFVPVPGFGAGHLDSNGNLGAYLDRRIFGVRHLWPFGTTPGVGVTFDPEGLLSTVPALATLLMGVAAGELLRGNATLGRRAAQIAAQGGVLLVLGLALAGAVPLIKKNWTPSFACLGGGVALLLFALSVYVIDVRKWQGWTLPFRVFGTNAIVAFVVSGVITTLLDRFFIGGVPSHGWIYLHLFTGWLSPRNGSLAYAVCIVGLNVLLLLPLYRRGWLVRI